MRKNFVRNILFIVLAVTVLVSCAPQFTYFDVDVLDRNSKELNLEGKTIAVFSVAPSKEADSAFISKAAIGVAEKIENDRNLDTGSIGVFSISKTDFENSFATKSIDTLYFNNLMLKSSSDIQVFVKDLIYSNYKKLPSNYNTLTNVYIIPYSADMEIYDALLNSSVLEKSIKDTIYISLDPYSTNKKDLTKTISSYLPDISTKIGEKLATSISKQWITQERMLVTYPDNSQWSSPYKKAMDFMWKDAIKGWLPLTKSNNMRKASYAAYNIAVACEIIDELDLAMNWIDFSINTYPFSESLMFKEHIKSLIDQKKNKK